MTRKVRVRERADFIALAPTLLGFHPDDSLVMMTITSFTARIDIPRSGDEINLAITTLLEPAKRQHVERVALVIYGEGEHQQLEDEFTRRLEESDIEVVAALQYTGGKYRLFGDTEWNDFDIDSHPITLDAIYADGGIKHASRAEMVESIKPCGETWDDETRAAVEFMQTSMGFVIGSLRRATAAESVELWTKALRGAEAGSELAADIAIVLAFSSWLKGDGAKAWAACDLARSSTWLTMMTSLLEQGVSPDAWPT